MWRICVTTRVPARRANLPGGSTTVETESRTICINVPPIVEKWRKPEPDPWVFLDGTRFELAHDLRLLATIADFSRDLSPRFARVLNASIEQTVVDLKSQLPEGAELRHHADVRTA